VQRAGTVDTPKISQQAGKKKLAKGTERTSEVKSVGRSSTHRGGQHAAGATEGRKTLGKHQGVNANTDLGGGGWGS